MFISFKINEKNARFKIISYFCGVMNKQYFIISLKKKFL